MSLTSARSSCRLAPLPYLLPIISITIPPPGRLLSVRVIFAVLMLAALQAGTSFGRLQLKVNDLCVCCIYFESEDVTSRFALFVGMNDDTPISKVCENSHLILDSANQSHCVLDNEYPTRGVWHYLNITRTGEHLVVSEFMVVMTRC